MSRLGWRDVTGTRRDFPDFSTATVSATTNHSPCNQKMSNRDGNLLKFPLS